MLVKGDYYSPNGKVWYHYTLPPLKGIDAFLEEGETLFITGEYEVTIVVPINDENRLVVVLRENSGVSSSDWKELVRGAVQLARDAKDFLKEMDSMNYREITLPNGEMVWGDLLYF